MIPNMAARSSALNTRRWAPRWPGYGMFDRQYRDRRSFNIQAGRSDVIAGGSEAALTDISLASFANATALSSRNEEPGRASRPFDTDRDGFVMAEGAGILVLESLSHALRRGAVILGEVIGYGASSDAYHMVATPEDGNGAARAMKLA